MVIHEMSVSKDSSWQVRLLDETVLLYDCLDSLQGWKIFYSSHELFVFSQLPDADALIQFLEIWELPQITSVIYLASVIKEVSSEVAHIDPVERSARAFLK